MAADLEHRECFLREAKAAAVVQNDHIITIYQVGQHEGSLYIAMQLLQGMSLEEWIERHNPVPLPQIVRIGREIANALSAFHECRLVHRDLKPANIWMEAPTDRVKLLDFGMVLAVSVPKPPHELRPDLPTPLADLIMQLLAKKPEDRPSSARVVEEVLMGLADNVLVGTPA
jgi:serine/threonine protein kinase